MKSCLLSVFAMLFVASTLNAQLVWDGMSSPWTHGTGTETDPYLIETPQNLAWLSDMVDNGLSNYRGVYFKQTEDFDMNGDNYEFNVIGSYTNGGTYFSGHYDGDFKSISNLVISGLSNYCGLFGYTEYATLKRICVNGISHNESNKWHVGSICGYAVRDTIIQCSCIDDVVPIEINNAIYNLGGLVGYADGSMFNQCYMIGDVTLTGTYTGSSSTSIGGLVGYACRATTFEQCFMRGDVKYARDYSPCNIGGLAGSISSENQNNCVLKIKSCYFIGDIIVTGNFNYADYAEMGLLFGRLRGGNNYYCSYRINHCYAVGEFTKPSSYITNDVMIGNSYSLFNITSNFNSYSGTDLPSTSSYATYRNDAYMKSAAMPILLNSGLDSTVFYFDYDTVNGGYPIFGYQQLVKYYTITTAYDASQGNVTGAGVYANGTTATLRAMPAEGYLFSGWSDGSTENPRTVTVTGDATYSANFTKNAYNIYIKQDCTVEVE